MSRLTKFEEYRDRYSDSYVLEKTDDGILLMRMHTDGGPVNWSKAVQATPNLFADVAGDRDVHIVIYTGTGDNFNANWRPKGEELEAYAAKLRAAPQRPAEDVEESGWFGRNRHNNMLEIDAIMIAAVNGPVTIHSELALMCDIILAADDAYFQDLAHFVSNLSPGDGVQNIWPRAIGLNRFRYWQLMGQKITAQQAYEWGAINEVLPKDKLLIGRGRSRIIWRGFPRYLTEHPPDLRTGAQAGGRQRPGARPEHGTPRHTSIHPDPMIFDGGVLPTS